MKAGLPIRTGQPCRRQRFLSVLPEN